MNQLEAVTFDVTGTLIHCPRMAEIYSEVLGRHGIVANEEDIRRLFPVVWQELDCRTPSGRDRFTDHPDGAIGWWGRLIERLCELLATAPPTPFTVAELYHRFAMPSSWEVYSDTRAGLRALERLGLRLAVVSNFDERLNEILAGLSLADHFEEVLYSAQLGIAKPDPRFFHHCLSAMEVKPGAALHVGNRRLEDVEGAEAAGMTAILIRRTGEGPGCTDLRELAHRVAGMLPGSPYAAV